MVPSETVNQRETEARATTMGRAAGDKWARVNQVAAQALIDGLSEPTTDEVVTACRAIGIHDPGPNELETAIPNWPAVSGVAVIGAWYVGFLDGVTRAL